MTRGAVRCSAWLGVAVGCVFGGEELICRVDFLGFVLGDLSELRAECRNLVRVILLHALPIVGFDVGEGNLAAEAQDASV